MKASSQLLKGEQFFQNHLQVYVNRAAESFDLPFHSHDFIELAFVAEGSGFHYLDKKTAAVRKGQLFVIPRGVSHVFRPSSVESLKNPLIVYNCVFSAELIGLLDPLIFDPDISSLLQKWNDPCCEPLSVMDLDGGIERLFLSLHQEFAVPQSGSSSYMYALILQLILTIHRLRKGEIAKPSERPSGFQQVLTYLERHHAENITLSSLAQRFPWTGRHLQRLFMKHTGQSFTRFLQNLRIQKSCAWLRSSAYPIGLIAEKVGYQDTDSFNSVFKRIVGMTPREYRDNAK